MPITIEIVSEEKEAGAAMQKAFEYFKYVDETFSVFKEASEVMRINRGELKLAEADKDVQHIFKVLEATKAETGGYFDAEEERR